MKQALRRYVVRTLRLFWFWIVAGLAVIAVGRYADIGGVGSVITGIGIVILCVGSAAMILDRARRMSQHEREQRNKLPRGL